MTQPCGSILCMKSRNHRFYIRASPIVCIADVIQFTLFVLLGSSRNPKVWLLNIKFELKERFQGESGARDKEAADNSILMRWILMILGASQFQAIKLMAMEGIPWTQAWAMMFGISIVFGEVLILLTRFLKLDGSSANTIPAWRRYTLSNTLDYVAPLVVLIAFFTSMVSIAIFYIGLFDGNPGLLNELGLISIIATIAISVVVLVPKITPRAIFRVNSSEGSLAVVLAFYTLLAGILYYGVTYDSSGTVNPDWTGIFG
ncbi:hypothetical protein N7490_009568 [Penicillium lividum]|nr:hypothetical protein N7490_009568 [Penicillium lividum]